MENRFYPIHEPWPFAPKPALGEHVMGYVRRLCEANDMESMRSFWFTTGLTTLCPWSVDAFWLQLQGLTGLSNADIDRLRWTHSGNLISLLGQPIRQKYLDNLRLRHCPECLREDGILHPPWSIFFVTACARHACQLEETCRHCGSELRLQSKTAIWDCTHCSTDIRTQKSLPAGEEEVALSATVEAYFGRSDAQGFFIPDLHEVTLNQLVTIVDRLGTLASANRINDRPTSRDRTLYGIGGLDRSGGLTAARTIARAGVNILRGWPQAYHELLANFVDRNPFPTQRNMLRRRFATEFGLLAIKPILDYDGTHIEFVSKELRRFCLERLNYRWGQRKRSFQPGTESQPDRHSPSVGSANLSGQVDPVSAAKQEPISDNYMSIPDAMNVLEGSPTAKIDPWFEAGLLSRRNGKVLLVENRQVQALLERIKHLCIASVAPNDCINISEIRGLRYPYCRSTFLQDVFSGSLPVYLAGEFMGLRSLKIERDELTMRRAQSRVQSMIQDNRYVRIHEINPLLEILWGPMASFNPTEARQWVIRGRLRHRYEVPIFGKSEFPRHFYHPTDLIRITQSMFRPLYFDLKAELAHFPAQTQDDSL